MKNKKKKEMIYKAVSDINADNVSDFIRYENALPEKAEKSGTYRPALRALATIAACFLVFGGMFAGLKYLEYKGGAATDPQAASAPDETKALIKEQETSAPDETGELIKEQETSVPDETETPAEEQVESVPDETEALSEVQETALPDETEASIKEKITGVFRLAKKTQTVSGKTSTTVYEYDESGRLIKETSSTTKIEYTYDDAGNTVKIYSDITPAYNQRTVTEDEREYSAEGRLISKQVKSTNYDAISACGTSEFYEKYEYDGDGRMIKMEQDGKIYIYTYTDENGSYILEGDGEKVTVTYNEKGLITTMSELYKGKDRITQKEYDEHGKLTKVFVNGKLIDECSYTYDGDAVIKEDFTSVTTGRRRLTYEYDEYNNVKGYTVCSDNGTIVEIMVYEWEPVSAE